MKIFSFFKLSIFISVAMNFFLVAKADELVKCVMDLKPDLKINAEGIAANRIAAAKLLIEDCAKKLAPLSKPSILRGTILRSSCRSKAKNSAVCNNLKVQ